MVIGNQNLLSKKHLIAPSKKMAKHKMGSSILCTSPDVHMMLPNTHAFVACHQDFTTLSITQYEII